MARAPALHAGGQEFDSLILHVAIIKIAKFIDIIEDEIDITIINRRSLYYKESK